ncbi:MAG: glycine--tRNA ligase subunit beta [Lautropia sp.]|nr:glycine--tRNA ligase subunit beta [Lautropia sp.]
MNPSPLLVELLTEELPPHALTRLAKAFSDGIHSRLASQQLLAEPQATVETFSTPRRLAVRIPSVLAQAEAREIQVKGPSVAVGLDADGQPTMALRKWAEKQGADVAALTRGHDGKQDVFFWTSTRPGAVLADVIGSIIQETLAQLPIPKVMTYQLADGLTTVSFVRPAHRLTVLHGDQVLPCRVFGIDADRITDGHRFLSKDSIHIRHADTYDAQLREEGKVEPDQQARRVMIADELARASQANGGLLAVNDEEQQQMVALLDEVTSLVEWPAVYTGQFDPGFLEVPQECLILSMRTNQRYFPLFDANNKLQNRFLIVSNMAISDPSAIIDGNERVVRPRLADARFFFDQDRQQPLAARLPQLAQVVYHARLGSQAERSERLQRLAATLAPLTGAQPADAERAAALAKTDLLTGMVGEFPELQGIMGRYYARHDGEPEAVAEAIAEHYQPRFAGDALPATPTGLALALADKLETLAGIWGIGQRPTGDKDPFALRRHALGVVRILIEGGLQTSLTGLLTKAFSVFDNLPADRSAPGAGAPTVATDKAAAPQGQAPRSTDAGTQASSPADAKPRGGSKGGKAKAADAPFTADVEGLAQFIADRLRSYLREQGYGSADIEAVLAVGLDRLDQLGARLSALSAFRQLPAFEALTAANKRIGNILRKSGSESTTTRATAGSNPAAQPAGAGIDPALLTESAEQQLHRTLITLQPQIEAHLGTPDFTAALQALAALQAPVDAFFEQVMVNAEDPAVRQNRLALLAALHDLMNRVADLAQL